jgi:hypothetical protein
MKVTRAIPLAAMLGLGASLFAVPAYAIPWGQGDYWGMTSHATNCDCQAPTATPQQASQETPSTLARRTNPPGSPTFNNNGSARELQQR